MDSPGQRIARKLNHAQCIAGEFCEQAAAIIDSELARPLFECAAHKAGTAGGNSPQDCDWPFCGCDEKASKVIEALTESGWKSPKETAAISEKLRHADLEIEALNKEIKLARERDALDKLITVAEKITNWKAGTFEPSDIFDLCAALDRVKQPPAPPACGS